MGKFKLFSLITLLMLMAGCVNMKPMSPNTSSKSIETTKESVVLLTLDLYRPDASRYIPHPIFVRIQKANVSGNDGLTAFQVDRDAGKAESETHNKFWFRLMLEPGDYTLSTINGMANAFPFIGGFDIPILLNFSVPKTSVVYIGDIQATLRPRLESEFRAGPVIPLIDQGVTGLSGGTFDVTIKDNSDEDLLVFASMFPVLKGIDIQKAMLPAWERSKAQLWWDTSGASEEKKSTASVSASTVAP